MVGTQHIDSSLHQPCHICNTCIINNCVYVWMHIYMTLAIHEQNTCAKVCTNPWICSLIWIISNSMRLLMLMYHNVNTSLCLYQSYTIGFTKMRQITFYPYCSLCFTRGQRRTQWILQLWIALLIFTNSLA